MDESWVLGDLREGRKQMITHIKGADRKIVKAWTDLRSGGKTLVASVAGDRKLCSCNRQSTAGYMARKRTEIQSQSSIDYSLVPWLVLVMLHSAINQALLGFFRYKNSVSIAHHPNVPSMRSPFETPAIHLGTWPEAELFWKPGLSCGFWNSSHVTKTIRAEKKQGQGAETNSELPCVNEISGRHSRSEFHL